MTLDLGRKRKGKEAFGTRFATFTRVPEAFLTLACANFEIAAPRDSPRGRKEGRNTIARTEIPEMPPQRLEKIQSAPGNGMASEGFNPQDLLWNRSRLAHARFRLAAARTGKQAAAVLVRPIRANSCSNPLKTLKTAMGRPCNKLA